DRTRTSEVAPFFGPGGVRVSVTPVVQADEVLAWSAWTHCRANTADVLGVPVAGEVATPAMLIRPLKGGDTLLELLGPTSADSPIWKRTPGLVSMASWQVKDPDTAVRHARAAGFTATDPAVGVLPGTRISYQMIVGVLDEQFGEVVHENSVPNF